MGIKNIHIFLIAASTLVAVVFGLWAINHSYQIGGMASFAVAIALIMYGIGFLKKVKGL